MFLPLLNVNEGLQLLLGSQWLSGLVLAAGAIFAMFRKRGNTFQKRAAGNIIVLGVALLLSSLVTYGLFGQDFVVEQMLIVTIPCLLVAFLAYGFRNWLYRQ